MRRIIIAALFTFAAAAAGAQTLTEALSYSENNYVGTARSMALGNAMTALGGDLGSIGINPAGSAVAGYSQFTISPGVTLMSNNAGYSTRFDEDYANFSPTNKNRFAMPNAGFSLKLDTYRTSGLKNCTVAVLANTTNQYLNHFFGNGINGSTSLLGSFGVGASPYSPSQLLDFNNFYDTNIPWNYLMAYQSGMISEAYDEFGNPMVDAQGHNTYLGTTEAMYKLEDGGYDIRTAGALDQTSNVESIGSKTDLLINLGLNFNDNLYLGFNIGMPLISYRYNESFRETAVDPSLFEVEYQDGAIANFSHATYEYSQSSDISGAYAKIGVIWLPFNGLRLGAAVQTPTAFTIEDHWYVSGNTAFTHSAYNTSVTSPDNSYSYSLTTPWRFNVGAALTLGSLGLLSADFETIDYSSMRFSTVDGNRNYFSVENDINYYFSGRQYEGRFGAEFKLCPEFSVRAGYSFKTSGEYCAIDKNGDRYTSGAYLAYYDDFESGRNWFESKVADEALLNTFSAGVGYSSNGSFFADAAVSCTKYPVKYFSPYSDYITGGDTYLPEVANTRTLANVVLTLGWRF